MLIRAFCAAFLLLQNTMADTASASSEAKQNTVTIDTPSGPITGVKTAAPETEATVYQFRKIPYAKPPVKDLRFRNPEPYGKWEGTLDATEFGPSCMQSTVGFMEYFNLPNNEVSEDCLFLNIYVPHNLKKDRKLPVMIWLHGGGFSMGQGMFYSSSTLSTFGDVIVVTINYRIGIFGLFSLGNEAALGNYGIWDQHMSFKWVHDNIEAFGGDPNAVTLFGQSAGSFSATLHAIIPANKGLFQRVISQSGTSLTDVGFALQAHGFSQKTGEELGCKMADSADVDKFMACIREKSATELQEAGSVEKMYDPSKFDLTIVLAPVVDGELFKDYPSKLLAGSYPEVEEFFYSLDFMIGTTSHEGSILMMFMASPQLQEEHNFNVSNGIPTNVVCNLVAKGMLKGIYDFESPEAVNAMCDQYTDSTSLEAQSMRGVDLVGDIMLVAPSIKSANLHSSGTKGSHTYFYQFSRPSNMIFFPNPTWFKGSSHGDDLSYTFGRDFQSCMKGEMEVSEDDDNVANTVMRYWTNFAKSGNPNKPVSDQGLVDWPTYDVRRQQYIDLNVECSVHSQPSPAAAHLFSEKIPDIKKKEQAKKREEL